MIESLINARNNVKKPLMSTNYDNLVLIDKKLPEKTTEALKNIQSTIGNFAKAHNLKVKFSAVKNRPNEFKIKVKQTVEQPVLYKPM